MYRTLVVLFCAAAIVAAGACGKTETEKRADDLKQAAEQMSKGAEGMAKGMEEMAKSFQAAAGAGENQKPVEPVSFTELQAAFPDLSGWTKGKPRGERMTTPVAYAEASVQYTKDDSELRVKLTDSAFNQMLTMAFSMMMATGYEKQTEEGFEKATKVGDYPGWEKRNNEGKSGELGILVNKRFVLQIEGSNLPDNKVLYQLAQAADLKKLGAGQ